MSAGISFGSIQNNIALKQHKSIENSLFSFGSIQNNIALKHTPGRMLGKSSFGSIQNNIALKPRRIFSFLQDSVIAPFIHSKISILNAILWFT
ncbi:hypothetical protein JSZ13_001547 [Listeria monocytogenes]|nr:hypothetical protein [Listeria monocytogenes]EHC6366961.1 hypothetical protein [Listeria monocytogenes]